MADEATSRANEFKGEGRVPNALRFGARVIDAKVESGKIDQTKAASFMAKLKDCEAADEPEEQKIIGIGQVIGAISAA